MYDDELTPCPKCRGQATVRDDLLVKCLNCGEHIGWYILTAGAVKLMPNWDIGTEE